MPISAVCMLVGAHAMYSYVNHGFTQTLAFRLIADIAFIAFFLWRRRQLRRRHQQVMQPVARMLGQVTALLSNASPQEPLR